MVLCIEISERTKSELDELLQVGSYKDYAQAIAIAVANQVVLQKQVGSSGPILIPGTGMQSSSEPHSNKGDDFVSAESEYRPNRPEHWAAPKIPNIFLLDHLPESAKRLAPPPDDVFFGGKEVPIDRWMFGQHNKLLPAKASCRALAHLQSACIEPFGLLASKVASEIAFPAVKLGDYLRAVDARRALHRDEALSIAFPYSGADSGDKARLRYGGQFVASVNRHGQLSGMLVDLKLINRIVQSKQPRILLTEAGWDFAKLQNPILDDESDNPTARFSGPEIQFLLDHISKAVPSEDFAYRTILLALNQGENTPDKLDVVLEKFLPERSEKPFTRAFLSTQRSGAISRMADLGLVERIREGIKVTYRSTSSGLKFLRGEEESLHG